MIVFSDADNATVDAATDNVATDNASDKSIVIRVVLSLDVVRRGGGGV